jgi:hypothetical protein
MGKNRKSRCNCKPEWDIRSKCEPECIQKNSLKEFNVCPERINTMIFWIENQYDLYQRAEKNDFSFLRDKYNMSEQDIAEVIKLYKESNSESD